MNGPVLMRPGVVLLTLAAAAGFACQDVVSSPGVCPEFCPAGEIRVRDTLLGGVEPVGSYSGYLLPHEAKEMQVVGPGGPTESRALVVFTPFNARYAGGDTTAKDSIIQTDSIRVRLNIVRRNTGVAGVTLAFHQIPITVDSATTFGDMVSYFQDSTLLATLPIADTLVKDTVAATFPAAALRHFGPDSLQIAIGVRISSPDPAFVSLAADSTGTVIAARMTRFVQVDSSTGTTRVTRSDNWGFVFKTFVADPSGFPTPIGLPVGGVAGARVLDSLNVPRAILDSALIVRATLLIPPARPTFGAPGDTFRLRVLPLGANFGPKAPLVELPDTASALVRTGSSDTVAIDITDILRTWKGTTLPRKVILWAEPAVEATSINTLEVPGPGSSTPAAILVTYALPFRLPGS